MNKEIVRLTKLWYEIVTLDHHKDRDCHWYINTRYSYGKKPTFTIEHYGYIGKEIDGEFKSYEEAEQGLIEEVNGMIIEQKNWAERVLKTKEQWEEYQIENAEQIIKLLQD